VVIFITFIAETVITSGQSGEGMEMASGAAFLSSLPEMMRQFSQYRMLAYSVVLVLVMIFKPGGIFGAWEFSLIRVFERLTGRKVGWDKNRKKTEGGV